jgi:hypothetical protein
VIAAHVDRYHDRPHSRLAYPPRRRSPRPGKISKPD